MWAIFFTVLYFSTIAGVWSSTSEEVMNAREGEDVVLKCRFPINPGSEASSLFWLRNRAGYHDNVAVGETTFSPGYTVIYKPEEGVYDLSIKSATYDNDNGNFECRKVETGSGVKLHSSNIELVVLLAPSKPVMRPTDPIVTESKPVNITCSSIGGSPPPDIVWYKNGERGNFELTYMPALNKVTPTTSTLTLTPTKEDDQAEFRCTVWNRAIPESETSEASTKIHVNYFPIVTVGPENPVRVERDDTAELKCAVDSKPAVQEVKWERNGRFINTNMRHMIPRANLKDAGPYKCSADNGLGKIVSAELELDVLFAPEVSVPPQREFSESEDIIIHCNVTANPPAHALLWTKEDDPEFRQVGSPLRLSGSNAAASNNGRYTCTATNFVQPTGRQRMERTGNATINISVKHAPGITFIKPDKPTVLEGGRVTLECGAKPPGYPIPTYTWWKEGSSNSVLATGASYTIDSARLNNGGRYYCRPTNQIGKGSVAETVLNVYQEPKLDIQLMQTITKRSGDTGYHVVCSAVGKPKPKIIWYKDNVEIDGDSSNFYQISVKELEVRNNEAFNVISTLSFIGQDRIVKDSLMPRDRGHYTCRFKNEVGTAESTMLLRIEHSPVVRHQHNKVAADREETAKISCRMQAYPSLDFEWSKGNSLLINRAPHSMSMTELGDDIYEGVLTISRVDESAYGEYACKASNQLGGQKTLITLQPKGKPEKPMNLEAIETGANSILLEWSEGFNGGYNKTTYNVEYMEEGGSLQFFDCRRRNPCNITSLNQYTKYHFKVKAVNIRGNSDWSREISLTTAVDVSKIPRPEHIFYETSTKTVSFNVINYPLGLVAKIELENPDKTYRPHARLGMNDRTFGQMDIADPEVYGLRVQLCLSTDESLCGDYGLADLVEVRQAPYSTAGLPIEGVIAIVIIAVLLAIAAVSLVVKCCFCSQPQPKKLTKDDIAGPNRLQNNHNYALDSKGVSAKDSADSPDIIKSQMYGYSYTASVPAPQVPVNQYDHQSSSNSNNGGSVNSQDSLWNVKHPVTGMTMPIDPAMTGYIGTGGYYGGEQPAPQYTTSQYNYEEYTHYPHPEDYINERNRAYFNNGDQYAMPSKPRNRLDSDYSPYGDVSGLPDPYTGHDISDELRHQGLDAMSASMSMQSAEEGGAPPPEGYSTPSRRVIREIIV